MIQKWSQQQEAKEAVGRSSASPCSFCWHWHHHQLHVQLAVLLLLLSIAICRIKSIWCGSASNSDLDCIGGHPVHASGWVGNGLEDSPPETQENEFLPILTPLGGKFVPSG